MLIILFQYLKKMKKILFKNVSIIFAKNNVLVVREFVGLTIHNINFTNVFMVIRLEV